VPLRALLTSALIKRGIKVTVAAMLDITGDAFHPE
jgi:hypothetical protein